MGGLLNSDAKLEREAKRKKWSALVVLLSFIPLRSLSRIFDLRVFEVPRASSTFFLPYSIEKNVSRDKPKLRRPSIGKETILIRLNEEKRRLMFYGGYM